MLREDYILAWIRRYVRWVLEIAGLIKVADHEAALRRIEQALRDLLGLGPDSVQTLEEGEIIARLTLGEPPAFAQEKCVVLAALLNHLASVCAARGQPDRAGTCYLRALHIMLGLRFGPPTVAVPEYAPRVEDLVAALQPYGMPSRTWAALMIYYEQTGRFAKAEDALFALLDAEPSGTDALEMGLGLYRRLWALSDDVLVAGDLPRAEIEAGLRELDRRLSSGG